jgi:hypothetical protein
MLFSLNLDARHMAARTVYDSLQLAGGTAIELCYTPDFHEGRRP